MNKNAIARTHAPLRVSFRTPNKTLYGRNCGNVDKGARGYAVFSYGEHFPLFVYDGAQWFANTDKFSRTTSQHYGQAHPHAACIESNTADLRAMVSLLDAGMYGSFVETEETAESLREAAYAGAARVHNSI